MASTFKSGNYNTFEILTKERIPSVGDLIRYTILPQIEDTLTTMLGDSQGVEGDSINVSQIVDKRGLQGFLCKIVYGVEAFKVPEAPQDAIQEDTENLIKSLSREDAHLKNLNIDVQQGKLSLDYEISL